MSFGVSMATAVMTASQAQAQMALAAKLAQSGAAGNPAVSTLLQAANANMTQLAQSVTAPGVGASLDITV